MQDLHAQAVDLSREYPEEAVNIQSRYDDLQTSWNQLSQMVSVLVAVVNGIRKLKS